MPLDPGRVYAAVRRIPRGRVAAYGQVAALAGFPRRARQVGAALRELPDGSDVPWQRVVNAQGKVSPRAHPGGDERQRALLEREGVRFDARGRIGRGFFLGGRGEALPEAGPPPARGGGKNRVSRRPRGR